MVKKNRVNIFGKTFHVTPSGRVLPLGKKNNWFTKCMHLRAKGNMAKGKNLSRSQIEGNRRAFREAKERCKSGVEFSYEE